MTLNRLLSVSCLFAVCVVVAACDKGSEPAATGAGSAKPAGTGPATAKPGSTGTAAATPGAAAPVGLKPGEMIGGSCDMKAKESGCMEVTVTSEAEKAKSLEVLKKICEGGTAAATPCSAEKRVGSCREGKDMINHFYSDGPKAFTADTAKTQCEKDRGHWVTP